MLPIVAILLSLVVWGFIFWLAWWGKGQIGIPEPFDKAAVIILVVGSIYVVIGLLMGFVPPFPFLTALF